ncbi:MAG: hypothetical protein ACTSQJ_19025, partial [Promethearchaeota archaeon]
SFIPLNKIRANPITLNVSYNEKIIGRAVDLIKFDPLFTKAFEYVFGRTIVVKDIETASEIDIKAKKVTLDGDVVDASNLMTGGGNLKKFNNIGFGLIEETKIPILETELERLEKEERAYSKEIYNIEKKIAEKFRNKITANNELSKIREILAISKEKITDKFDQLNELRRESENVNFNIQKINQKIKVEVKELNEINEIIANLKKDEKDIEIKINLLKDNDFTNKVNSLKNEINSLEKHKIKLELEIAKLETQIEEITKSQEIELEENFNKTNSEIEKYTFSIEKLRQELEELEATRTEIETEVVKKNQKIGQFYAERDTLLKNQTTIKIDIENLKTSIHPKNIKINTLEINHKNIEAQKKELENSIHISDEEISKIQEFLNLSQERLSEIVQECLQIKLELEPVNMRAIKKYDKIKKRYDDLIEKHKIVVEERFAILNFIERIEKEKKNTFLNSFYGINNHFKNIFAKLSPEGEAKLELENPEDPFEGGIKMLARPGGKKWCLTQSMSGGEKT